MKIIKSKNTKHQKRTYEEKEYLINARQNNGQKLKHKYQKQ